MRDYAWNNKHIVSWHSHGICDFESRLMTWTCAIHWHGTSVSVCDPLSLSLFLRLSLYLSVHPYIDMENTHTHTHSPGMWHLPGCLYSDTAMLPVNIRIAKRRGRQCEKTPVGPHRHSQLITNPPSNMPPTQVASIASPAAYRWLPAARTTPG